MKCARLEYWNENVPFTVSSTFAEPDTPNILLPFTMFSGFKLASPATCTAPVVYLPEVTAVCVEVLGVTVFAPCVVSCCVALIVPSATMPPTCTIPATAPTGRYRASTSSSHGEPATRPPAATGQPGPAGGRLHLFPGPRMGGRDRRDPRRGQRRALGRRKVSRHRGRAPAAAATLPRVTATPPPLPGTPRPTTVTAPDGGDDVLVGPAG